MAFDDRFRDLLAQMDLHNVDLDRVAADLQMSGSTLRRKLRACGCSFKQIIDAERMRRCEKAIKERGRGAAGKVLAHELGYTEVNSFYRAFQRWYGVTFRSVRAEL